MTVGAWPTTGELAREVWAARFAARPGEPEALRTRRAEAFARYAVLPLPDTRSEEWRYTDIAEWLREASWVPAEPAAAQGWSAEAAAVPAAGRLRHVDGVAVHAEMDGGLAAQGVRFADLAAALAEDPDRFLPHLGRLVSAEDGKFPALNLAAFSGGAVLWVPPGVRLQAPLHWLEERQADGFVASRLLVVLGRNAEASLLWEMRSGPVGHAVHHSAVEVVAEEGARFHLWALQRFGPGVVHLRRGRVEVGRDAHVTTLEVSLGADLARSELETVLARPGARAELYGLYVGDEAQHLDHETLQDHVSAHASSNLLYKGALRDHSRSVFRGLIRVHKGAQRTDAYQTNRNLLLSRHARADSLPNLEIGADDVRCSHAATVGQVDAEELFYLRSRGIPMAEAVRLVVFGFFGEVLDEVPDAAVREALAAAIQAKLDAHGD
ncbi:MAG TPA: Fe-S cluster assembly protein SufD [Chloroflexota bacterium]